MNIACLAAWGFLVTQCFFSAWVVRAGCDRRRVKYFDERWEGEVLLLAVGQIAVGEVHWSIVLQLRTKLEHKFMALEV